MWIFARAVRCVDDDDGITWFLFVSFARSRASWGRRVDGERVAIGSIDVMRRDALE